MLDMKFMEENVTNLLLFPMLQALPIVFVLNGVDLLVLLVPNLPISEMELVSPPIPFVKPSTQQVVLAHHATLVTTLLMEDVSLPNLLLSLAHLTICVPSGTLVSVLPVPELPTSKMESVLLLTHFAEPSIAATDGACHATLAMLSVVVSVLSLPTLILMDQLAHLTFSVPDGIQASVSHVPMLPILAMVFVLLLTLSARHSMELMAGVLLATQDTC